MPAPNRDDIPLEDDPLWYKDALIYEVHVRAFFDSDDDGRGDFRGLTAKLDYLQDLGVTTLWLLPFYPSPLKDDGYDIADYTTINPAYGTLSDFRALLKEAHRRGLRVITELVLNHTSDQHPWFQRARTARPGSVWRNFYVWSDTPEKYKEARIIFKDFETSNWSWDPVAKAYYWHRFYSHQPDLNFHNPAVRRALFQVVDFWLKLGVDGLRLDAVPYLYEAEGTNCENLPQTHAYLKDLHRYIEARYKNRMLLAEANQWPEDAAAYFGGGTECQMAFHFPIMPRLFMAIRMEDRFPIIDILEQTPSIADTCQWALFLRNHDELTLEMVTDEERDYMYRVYANDPQMRINLGIRRRLAPLLFNDRRRFELMKGLLFSLPGTPVLYYGDEIGMGDNIYLGDRNGVRTPMQWSPDRNAGFSQANPQKLFLPVIVDPEYHFEAINVMAQQSNQYSLLWWMKRLIALRKRYKAFGRGSIEFLYPENHKVLAFMRHHEDAHILIVANLSRLAQYVELDLSAYEGLIPTELLGSVEFPPIGELPYLLTLGPHAFFWFALEPRHVRPEPIGATAPAEQVPVVTVSGKLETLFQGKSKSALEKVLPAYLLRTRWFGGKGRRIKGVEIGEHIAVPYASGTAHLLLIRVEYVDSDAEWYTLPVSCLGEEQAREALAEQPQSFLARVEFKDQNTRCFLIDALREKAFNAAILDAIARRRSFKGAHGELVAYHTRPFRQLRGGGDTSLEPTLIRSEQSNSSICYGDRLILKIFRRLDRGTNPDLEVGQFLTARLNFKNTAPVAGAIEYHFDKNEPVTVAFLQGFIPDTADAWRYTLDSLGGYFERALTQPLEAAALPPRYEHLLSLPGQDLPPLAQELISPYLDSAKLLGVRTAELHLALASGIDDPHFAPEPFTLLYQRSLYQSMRNRTGQALRLLRSQLKELPRDVQEDAARVYELRGEILRCYRRIIERKISTTRIRIHGDYHLGQVLFTGKDFVIIDFEGEPARPMSERRFKRSPLRDVAGMLRSFHYAAHTALRAETERGLASAKDPSQLEPWSEFWYVWVSTAFLRAYTERVGPASFLPPTLEERRLLLNCYMLEKAIYELRYELDNRPDWVRTPIQGILQLIQEME